MDHAAVHDAAHHALALLAQLERDAHGLVRVALELDQPHPGHVGLHAFSSSAAKGRIPDVVGGRVVRRHRRRQRPRPPEGRPVRRHPHHQVPVGAPAVRRRRRPGGIVEVVRRRRRSPQDRRRHRGLPPSYSPGDVRGGRGRGRRDPYRVLAVHLLRHNVVALFLGEKKRGYCRGKGKRLPVMQILGGETLQESFDFILCAAAPEETKRERDFHSGKENLCSTEEGWSGGSDGACNDMRQNARRT